MMASQENVDVEESPVGVAAEAAERFVHLVQQATATGKPFRVAISGGSTPRLLYRILASEAYREDVPWERIEFFFGDERWVAPTHPDSNYKLAQDELFSKVPVDKGKVYPIPTEGLSPDEAAAEYEDTLQWVFEVEEGEVPRFDLIFLGMGDEGHTASLFPHSSALHEDEKLVAAPYVDKVAAHRITLTPIVLTSAAEVLPMITGQGKASALHQVLQGEYNPDEYPIQILRSASGRVTWLVDKAAAAELVRET